MKTWHWGAIIVVAVVLFFGYRYWKQRQPSLTP